MLQFSDTYFSSEERSGYPVGEAVKRVWAAQIEILHKISEVCEKYGLTYYIFWGSLLGAVRHQGFIPWDDDIDIAMLGEDYIRFLEIAEKELPEGYHVFNPYKDDELDSYFTRVTNRKEIDLSGSWSKEYHGCPLSMGVDIFPLYYIPKDKRMAEEQKQVLSFVKHLKDIINFRKSNPEQSEEEKKENDLVIAQSLIDIQNMTGYQFTSKQSITRQLDLVFDQISRIATREESDCVASFDEYIVNNRRIYPIAYFEEPIQLPFENVTVIAPKEYDAILRETYGKYMVPRNTNKLEEHAAVREQLKTLGKQIEACYYQKKNAGKPLSIKPGDISKVPMSYEKAKDSIPEEWLNRIFVLDSDGKLIRKKVLLYYLSVDKLIFNCAHVIDKLKRTFEVFSRQNDVVIWWLASFGHDDVDGVLEGFVPETMEAYKQAVSEYLSKNIGIYDDSGNILRAMNMCDAYYGDEGLLVPLCVKIGRKVMIQDYLV